MNIIAKSIKINRRGDTLIEVIFAFAILATIIGFAFTGVIQARKSAVAAQQRTQALDLVQYQSSALVAYRDSLPWNSSGDVVCPSFVNGGCALSLPNLVGSTPTSQYCMVPASATNNLFWRLQTGACPVVDGITQSITFKDITSLNSGASGSNVSNNSTEIQADVVANWVDTSGNNASTHNIVILTQQK